MLKVSDCVLVECVEAKENFVTPVKGNQYYCYLPSKCEFSGEEFADYYLMNGVYAGNFCTRRFKEVN